MITSYNRKLPPGTIVIGRWNKSVYRIERMLGQGANGCVYLVIGGSERRPQKFAMKIGFDASDIQSEINLLKKLAPKSGLQKNFFIEADDFTDNVGQIYAFYVMQYVQGMTLSIFIEQKGPDWLYLTGYYLLSKLAALHARGFAFGDVKPSNIVVADYGRLELIDYGGATPFGKSVRQFTELYDRGYWDCGERSADCGYDLFAFCILFMQLANAPLPGKSEVQPLPHSRSRELLLTAVDECTACRPVAAVLRAMINGEYRDSRKAAEDWRSRMHRVGLIPRVQVHIPWVKGFAIASACLFAISLYVTLQ